MLCGICHKPGCPGHHKEPMPRTGTHTPTPWVVQLDFDPEFSRSTHIETKDADRIATLTAYILASNDPELLKEHDKINHPSVRDANAAFIVLAVNNFEALVDVVKQIEALSGSGEKYWAILTQARAVLAALEK